jgi:hypothetical protein
MKRSSYDYRCSDSEADRNRFLDGETRDSLADYFRHLNGCSTCRALHQMSEKMVQALAQPKPIFVPVDLASRILAQAQVQRQTKPEPKKGNWNRFLAIAASLLVMGLIAWVASNRNSTVPVRENLVRGKVVENRDLASNTPIKLRDRLSQAGSNLLNRTQRATSESIPNLPLANVFSSPPKNPEPATLTIDQLGSGASSTLRPITDSTRRAINLFRRELPALDPNLKPNS